MSDFCRSRITFKSILNSSHFACAVSSNASSRIGAWATGKMGKYLAPCCHTRLGSQGCQWEIHHQRLLRTERQIWSGKRVQNVTKIETFAKVSFWFYRNPSIRYGFERAITRTPFRGPDRLLQGLIALGYSDSRLEVERFDDLVKNVQGKIGESDLDHLRMAIFITFIDKSSNEFCAS